MIVYAVLDEEGFVDSLHKNIESAEKVLDYYRTKYSPSSCHWWDYTIEEKELLED